MCRKQYLLIVQIHGLHIKYCELWKGYLDILKASKENLTRNSQHQFYTALSCAKSCTSFQVLNFVEDHIKANNYGLKEMGTYEKWVIALLELSFESH